jgi:predicted ATPase
LFFRGQFAAAREHFEQVLALYDRRQHRSLGLLYAVDPKVVSLIFLAQTLWYLGYPDQASGHIQQGLSLAQELAHPYSWSGALVNAAWLAQYCGDAPATQVYADTAIVLASERGFSPHLEIGRICRGWAVAAQSRPEAGLTELREGLAAYRATQAKNVMPYHLGLLSELYGKAGQIDNGLAAVAEALDIINKTGERQREAELYRLKGELSLQSGIRSPQPKLASPQHPAPRTPAEAEACFHQAIEIARRQQAKSLELWAVTSLARLWQQQGKRKKARQMLAEIYNWFTEGFGTKDLQEAKALLDELK